MEQHGTRPIETERLLLRRFTLDDAGAMFQNWAADPEVTRFLRFEPHGSVEDSRAVLADWVPAYEKPDYYSWAITLKVDGTVIGSLGVMPVGPNGEWEPGYCIGRRWWNRGYASEALRAAVDHVAADAGTEYMVCCHAVDNPASGRVMERAGFVYTHPGSYEAKGRTIPARFYELKLGKRDDRKE